MPYEAPDCMILEGNIQSIRARKHSTRTLVDVHGAADKGALHNKAACKLVSYDQGIRHLMSELQP